MVLVVIVELVLGESQLCATLLQHNIVAALLHRSAVLVLSNGPMRASSACMGTSVCTRRCARTHAGFMCSFAHAHHGAHVCLGLLFFDLLRQGLISVKHLCASAYLLWLAENGTVKKKCLVVRAHHTFAACRCHTSVHAPRGTERRAGAHRCKRIAVGAYSQTCARTGTRVHMHAPAQHACAKMHTHRPGRAPARPCARAVACTHSWTGGRVDGRAGGRTDGRTGGRVDGRTDGRTDGLIELSDLTGWVYYALQTTKDLGGPPVINYDAARRAEHQHLPTMRFPAYTSIHLLSSDS